MVTVYKNPNDDDATAKQKRAITQLCQRLGIKEPLEEQRMSQGEAGRLIRELQLKLDLVRTRKSKIGRG